MKVEPKVGEQVLYVMPGGVSLPGIVTLVWQHAGPGMDGMVNMVVFGDGKHELTAARIRLSVDHDPAGERVNTWHYPR